MNDDMWDVMNHDEADGLDHSEQLAARGIWTTKDGQEIPVSELGDRHLQNIARLLVRNAKADADAYQEDKLPNTWLYLLREYPIWSYIEAELQRRGFDNPAVQS